MGRVVLLLDNGFLVCMVIVGCVGFVVIELGEIIFEVVLGVFLVVKKIMM